MADFGISAGQFVAVIWDKSSPVEALKDLVDKLQALTGDEGRVSVENINQLLQCKYLPRLSFRAVMRGVLLSCRSLMAGFLFQVAHDSGCFSWDIVDLDRVDDLCK